MRCCCCRTDSIRFAIIIKLSSGEVYQYFHPADDPLSATPNLLEDLKLRVHEMLDTTTTAVGALPSKLVGWEVRVIESNSNWNSHLHKHSRSSEVQAGPSKRVIEIRRLYLLFSRGALLASTLYASSVCCVVRYIVKARSRDLTLCH